MWTWGAGTHWGRRLLYRTRGDLLVSGLGTHCRIEQAAADPVEDPGGDGEREAEGQADEEEAEQLRLGEAGGGVGDLGGAEGEEEEHDGADELAGHGDDVAAHGAREERVAVLVVSFVEGGALGRGLVGGAARLAVPE